MLDCLYLFTYRSRPVQTNKEIDDFFFACGCRAGILLDFQTIIERGPEIFTGEPGEIDEDGWHYPITSIIIIKLYWIGTLARDGEGEATEYCASAASPSGPA